ncbi:hypothetical protein NC651_010181 [Populus alba x Populus x berolinensis]|nr:hypothetical protein NC651_010181 [Populus alba x Populus x berolinensis]
MKIFHVMSQMKLTQNRMTVVTTVMQACRHGCLVASYKNIVSVHIDQATADSKAPLFTFPLSLLRE